VGLRCSTEASSDTILGHGWADKGYSATEIDPRQRTRRRAPGHPGHPEARELFVTEFIPMPPQGLVTDRVARNVEEARKAVRLLFDSTTKPAAMH
jgi:hypothetical protein